MNSNSNNTDNNHILNCSPPPTSVNERTVVSPSASAESARISNSSSAAPNRGKFIKSKSSPSSLTTHKFGLRPTPSPPRLIIDHQTGDIVERYPEDPVYLRTFQPIEDNEPDDYELDDDTTQDQIDESFASTSTQLLHQNLLEITMSDQHQHTHARPNQHQRPAAALQHQHQHSTGQVIPPPHSGKVYFAPPVTSNNLFDPHLPQNQPLPGPSLLSTVAAGAGARAGGSPNSAFRQVVSNLGDNERTDIAIVTEPDDYDSAGEPPRMKITATSASRASDLLAKQQQQRASHVTSSSANKLYGQPSALLARSPSSKMTGEQAARWKASQQQQRQQFKRQLTSTADQRPASINDQKLYDFCFNLRILLVLSISALSIYLLVLPLHSDCTKFRPTHTYVSIITSSVNLIFVAIFTLFWYCSSVSRTLYQNLSASAFIVSIYSILVCVNLTLAILFFFMNTCHFQKLLVTHSALAEVARQQTAADDYAGPLLLGDDEERAAEATAQLIGGDLARYANQRRALGEVIETLERAQEKSSGDQTNPDSTMDSSAHSIGLLAAERIHRVRRHKAQATGSGEDDDGATVLDDQLAYPPPTTSATTTSATPAASAGDFFNQDHASGYEQVPEVSPIEAAWEYVKEQAREFRRSFHKFLLSYDLKFIGALHALCAACFQYLAIKVAVLRTFYCSPLGPYA